MGAGGDGAGGGLGAWSGAGGGVGAGGWVAGRLGMGLGWGFVGRKKTRRDSGRVFFFGFPCFGSWGWGLGRGGQGLVIAKPYDFIACPVV